MPDAILVAAHVGGVVRLLVITTGFRFFMENPEFVRIISREALDDGANLGIDLATRRICVVKSTNHFFAEFGPIAEEVLYTDAPGAIPRDFARIPYTRIPRPIWPLDADPWAA